MSGRRLLALLAALVLVVVAIPRLVVASLRRNPDPLAPDLLTAPVGKPETVVTDDGARLAAVIAGSGATVVLVHGMLLSTRLWRPVFEALVDAGHRVIAYDQRGHGESTVGTEPYSIDRLGRDLAAVVEYFDLRAAAVVGHSMGGMAALALMAAVDGGDRVGAGVLVGASADALRLPRRLAAAGSSLTRTGRFARSFSRPVAGSFVARAGFGRRPGPSQVEATRAMMAATRPLVAASAQEAIMELALGSRLAAVRMPVLVVCGTWDTPHTKRMSVALARDVPGAEMVWLAGAGHMVPYERPTELAALITDFVRRHVGSAWA